MISESVNLIPILMCVCAATEQVRSIFSIDTQRAFAKVGLGPKSIITHVEGEPTRNGGEVVTALKRLGAGGAAQQGVCVRKTLKTLSLLDALWKSAKRLFMSCKGVAIQAPLHAHTHTHLVSQCVPV